uniref:Uncharacterized protein n=1 Tax=Anopheles minimus TaxID=112268 RepID=A0A182WFH7_9DIPT
METYSIAITRLCVLTEINNMPENVITLADYLANDLRLLKKMDLSNESEAIFYRLYKNVLHAVVKCCLDKPHEQRPGIKFEQYGKRVQEFIAALIEQLNCNDCFAAGRHVANALCNMLILTQESYACIPSFPVQQMSYCIEPEVLQKLSKYIERHVFIGKAESNLQDTNCLLAKKLMLVTYNDVYKLHLAITDYKDTCHILKYYEEKSLFSEELEQLLSIVFENGRNEYSTTVTQIVVDFCKKFNYITKAKNFLSGLHRFQEKNLPDENGNDYLLNIIQHIVDQILATSDGINEVQPSKAKLIKLLDVMHPWVNCLPPDYCKQLTTFIRNHENYVTFMEDEHPIISAHLKKFLKYVKKIII